MPLLQPSLKSQESREMSFAHSKLLWVAGVCMIVLVVAIHVVTIARQAPWEDEVFVVSTGLSMARSQPPIMSVMAQYPQTNSPIKFYGPVSFAAAALEIRAFGLSVAPWRLICFAGVIFTLLVSIALVRLAGGGKWPRLITGLVLALAGSTATQLPGRWDFVTCGLFLSGLFFFLKGVEAGGRALLWRVMVAGGFIGFALGSTPRVLTLCLAAGISILLAALLFGKARKNLLFGAFGILLVAPLVQTLLLLPSGLNSFSWYAFVKDATKLDAANATPVVGPGTWDLGLSIHKSLLLVFLLFFAVALSSAVARRRSAPKDPRLPFKVLLSLFALVNLSLMLLLIGRSLGQSGFWMPPAVIALMCWFDWESLRAKKLGSLAAAFVGLALIILTVQEARQELAIVLTWNRRSTADLTTFIRRTLPENAVVYGPVGGYFYPVEMAGSKYLYLQEEWRGGPSEPHASVAKKYEEEICSHPTYAIWPEPDPAHLVLWGPMPEALQARSQARVGEFHEPGLPGWKEGLLRRIGLVGAKYGYPDVSLYPLKALVPCAQK
jgi:hypothetical protein